MTVYRYQVISVGLWRGQVKRWNTTFHYPLSDMAGTLHALMQKAGYLNPGDTDGACSGGVAEVVCYNAAGGPPVNKTTYFDWQDRNAWLAYTGELWADIPAGTPIDSTGEAAVVVVGHMPGLSSTGKPVTTRKYLHAAPARTATDFNVADVPVAIGAAFATAFGPSIMRNPAGVQPTSVTCNLWYGNHQRVRGRRRTVKQVASQSFSAGVVAGAGASASGGQPFQ